ncbi:MAG TPA: ABC transporter substrate-binding protein [Firmicutes bacterium]|nr:ABC transporter substrate-binding protein [Bacillota bacterium]
MRRARGLVLVGLVVLLVVGLVGCGGAGSQSKQKVLRVAIGMDVVTLDPHDTVDFKGLMVANNVYERLVKYDPKDNSFKPWLAKSWEVSGDGLRWTFHLDESAKFASGNPVTAEAVRYSLVRGIKQKMFPSWMLSQCIDENALNVVDERTVEITLAKPYAPLLAILSSVVASAVDPEVIAQHEQSGDMGKLWLKDHSAGSGPFVVDTWQPKDRIVLKRNPNYWGKPPKLDEVVFLVVPEASSQAAMVERGDVDVAQDLLPDQVEQLVSKGGFQKLELPDTVPYYLAMNLTFEPFKKKEVGQAIRYAIDYEGLIKDVVKGYAVQVGGILAPGVLGYDPGLCVKQDLSKARELMRQAGYGNGFSVTMHYQSAPIKGLGIPPENVAVKIQSDLAQIGIKVEPIKQDASTLLEPYRSGKIPFAMWMWGPVYPDPDNIITSHGDENNGGSKRLSYVNHEVTQLIQKARESMDPAERVRLYKQVQAIEADSGPWVWLFVTKNVQVARANVKGYELIPYWTVDLASVDVE